MSPALDSVRAALANYADPIRAVHDGYFSSLWCISFPHGGMGVHFLNFALVGQPPDPLRPQVLIYEPVGDSLRLAAAEWFVPTAVTKERPEIFGRSFDGPMMGHEPLMPGDLHHWDLHVWLWKENPAGLYSPTNPGLKCPATGYTLQETAPKMVTP